MEAALSQARFDWRFFDGVTTQSPGLWDSYSRLRNLLFHKYSVSAPELACYLSHRAMWREIASGTAPAALVFEDDALIVDDTAFYQAINDIRHSLDLFEIVKFHDFRPKDVAVSKRFGRTTLVSFRSLPTSTACYLITRAGAQKMLRRRHLFRPVDQDWTNAWEFGLRMWSVHPNPVATDDEGNSAIQQARNSARRSLPRVIWNEVLTLRKKFHTTRYHRSLMRDSADRPGQPGVAGAENAG